MNTNQFLIIEGFFGALAIIMVLNGASDEYRLVIFCVALFVAMIYFFEPFMSGSPEGQHRL